MRIHEATCSRRSRRISFRAFEGQRDLVPARFGGSASRVRCDNVPHQLDRNNIVPFHVKTTIEQIEDSERLPLPTNCPREKKVNELATLLMNVKQRTGGNTVQNLLSILNHDDFDLSLFQKKYKKPRDCVEFVDRTLENQMSDSGFEKKVLRSKNGTLECFFYKRDPVNTLKHQVQNSHRSMYLSSSQNDTSRFLHPMSAGIGTRAVPVVTSIIRGSSDRNVYWREAGCSEFQSFVRLGQLYSDKTQTSLKSSSTSLYPLHLTLLKFQEGYRRDIIASGSSIITFLPVEYLSLVETSSDKTFVVSRLEKMKLLHAAIEEVLEPLKMIAMKGFPCHSDDMKLHCHFIIANYCCDIPEARDILGLKLGSRSRYGCHRCFITSSNMSKNITSNLRNMNETINCREEAKRV